MAEIPCAKVVLAQLPSEVLSAIKSICDAAKTGLQTLKTGYQSLQVSIDIDLFPLKLKKTALDKIISEAREKAKIIPAEMVIQCPQLGAINTTIEGAIVGQLEGIANIVFDIDRLTSVKIGYTAQVEQVDSALEFLDAVVAAIDEVLGG